MNSQIIIEIDNIKIELNGDFDMKIDNGIISVSHKENKVSETKNVSQKEMVPISSEDDKPNFVEKSVYDVRTIRSGMEALYGLVETWKKNFDVPDTKQPNRIDALRQCMNLHGDQVIQYLQYSKGLTNGIVELFPPMPDATTVAEIDHIKFLRKIACNITQVGSIVSSEISTYLEPHCNYIDHKFYW